SRQRQKVTRACDACKARKKRCTGDHPCAPCIKARGKCSYDAQYNRGIAIPPSPAPQAYSHITPGPRRSGTSVTSPTYTTSSQLADGDLIAGRQSVQHGLASDLETDRDTSPNPLDDIDPRAVPVRPELATRRSISEQQQTIDGQYLGPSSAQSFLGQALQRSDRGSVQNLTRRPESHFETETSTLSFGDAKVCQPGISQSVWPEYKTATRLLERYFEFSSPTYRYMHEPTVNGWLREIYDEADVPVATTACILLIFASAAVFTVDSLGDTIDASHQGWHSSEMYYQKAESLLSQEAGPPRLESVQARFAAVQYLLSSSRPNRALFTFGTMIQLMQAVGIHRRRAERANDPTCNPIIVQMQRRLFWCAFTLDKYLSIVMGRLSLLHIDDTNQELPMVVNDEDLTAEGVRQQDKTHARDCLLHATLAHIEVGIILARASQEQNRLPSTTDRLHVEAAARRSNEIRDWQSKLTPILSGAIHPSSLIPSFRRQHSILALARLHAIMFVTRPLLLRDPSTELSETEAKRYRDQLRSCIQAAREAIETISGTTRYRVLFPAFWFSQYIAFSAISIIHIYIIQLSRQRIPTDLFGTTSHMDCHSLYELASTGQKRLAETGIKSAPVWRYGPILEGLSAETGKYVASQTNEAVHVRSSSVARTMRMTDNNNAQRSTNNTSHVNQDIVGTPHYSSVQPFESDAMWVTGNESLWSDLMAENLDNNNLTMDFWPQFDNLPVGML
ncbi:unnamed protein product, partial [Aureobasidium uvarum]